MSGGGAKDLKELRNDFEEFKKRIEGKVDTMNDRI